MIQLYGTPVSRAQRSLWALEEVGVEYENIPTHFVDESKTPEHLARNPNGRIPVLVDGDLTLWESMAINLYLARKYDGGLQPKSADDVALAVQWSFWGMTELEAGLLQILLNRVMLPEDQRDVAKAEAADEALQRPLKVLDAHLADRPYLLRDEFTIADLNVASVLGMGTFAGYDFSKHSNVQRWFDACTSRPAFQRSRGGGA